MTASSPRKEASTKTGKSAERRSCRLRDMAPAGGGASSRMKGSDEGHGGRGVAGVDTRVDGHIIVEE